MTLGSRPASASRCTPSTARTSTRCCSCADVAMYQAKEDRTGVELYAAGARQPHPGPARTCSGRSAPGASTHDELRAALPAQGVAPPAAAGRRRGAGPLGPPERGLVCPDEFIALAEQSGLMRSSPQYVLDDGARAGRRVVARAGSSVPVAVNVSRARPARPPASPSVVAACCAGHGVPAGALQLEITEHVLMADPHADAAHAARRWAGSASTLSLDDFGTGYSSLRPPQAAAGLRDQDRPLVRAADGRRRRRRRDRALHRRPGPLARAARRRRGRRDDRDLAGAARPWAATPPRAA